MSTVVPIERETALKLIDGMKRLDVAIEAYKRTMLAFTKLHPEHADLLNELLSAELRDPVLLGSMRQKYSVVLDMMHIEEIDADVQKKIDRLIVELKPTDPLN
jgi:hypothetical protein